MPNLPDLNRDTLRRFLKAPRIRIENGGLQLQCAQGLEEQAELLLQSVQGQLGQQTPARFRCQVGPVLIKISAEGELQQPDFMDENPISSPPRPDLTQACLLFGYELLLASRTGAPGQAYSMLESVLVDPAALIDPEVKLSRLARAFDGDSGWRLLGTSALREGAPEPHYEPNAIHEIFRVRPSLLCAMSLPVGYQALFEGETLLLTRNPENHVVYQRKVINPNLTRSES